jgi:predicted RNA methylase
VIHGDDETPEMTALLDDVEHVADTLLLDLGDGAGVLSHADLGAHEHVAARSYVTDDERREFAALVGTAIMARLPVRLGA